MDAFETICAGALRQAGYWVIPGLYVSLSMQNKTALDTRLAIPALGKPIFKSFPRTQLDIVAYKPEKNELLIVECKSYLDSAGVSYATFNFPAMQTNPGKFKEYKLFQHKQYFDCVSAQLILDLKKTGLIASKGIDPDVKLVLMSGKIADKTNTIIRQTFRNNGWKFVSPRMIIRSLKTLKNLSYHNDPVVMAAKLLLR